MAKMVIENYRVWFTRKKKDIPTFDMYGSDPATRSTLIADAAAVVLAYRPDLAEIRTIPLEVAERGETLVSEKGIPIPTAVGWKNVQEFYQLVQVVADAAVVVTPECDGPVGLLDQDGGPVAVCFVERADGEHPLSAVLPHLRSAEFRTVFRYPVIQIEIRDISAWICLRFRDTFPRCRDFHLLRGDDAELLRDGKDLRHPVRSGLDIIARAVHCPRYPPDPSRIEHCEIDIDFVISGSRDPGDAPLDEIAIRDRKIDAVHHLRTVAGVDQDGIGPAGSGQTIADLARH